MSNSTTAAKSFFVMNSAVEHRSRLEGTWLNIFDVTVPPGSGTPPHTHASPEIFRILEGRLTIWRMTDTGPVETVAAAGDIISIPACVPHGYSNPNDEPAIFSAIVDKDMADFYEAVDAEAPSPAPSRETIERVAAAAEAHGISILPQ